MTEEDYRPQDPAMERRWRRALETAGIHVVRGRFLQSTGGSGAVIGGIGTEHITRRRSDRMTERPHAVGFKSPMRLPTGAALRYTAQPTTGIL
jgi:hypothetical protein